MWRIRHLDGAIAARRLLWTCGLRLACALAVSMPVTTMAFAQGAAPTASLACRRQCDAQGPAASQRDRQVCLLRCTAGEQYMARQRQAGTPEATGQGTRPGRDHDQARGTEGGLSMVAYAGHLPQPGLALSRRGDRQMAHRTAERSCYRSNGNRPCRLLIESLDRCIAVTQGIRGRGLIITGAPDTYIALLYGVGSGQSEAQARQAAQQDCESRLAPGMTCRMAASRCG